jgi:PadR family transcriptional regulator, regulatory protein AphA
LEQAMPRTKAPPTAAEYAILGSLREAPAHGYLVAQRFATGNELGLLYHLEQSAVYALLHDLEDRALIAGVQDDSGARPPRTLFCITDAGETHLRSWLALPVEPIRRMRLDFLLKLHFTARQSPAEARALVAGQLKVCEAYLSDLNGEIASLEPNSLERLIVESKRAAVDGFATWLTQKRESLSEALTPSAAGQLE